MRNGKPSFLPVILIASVATALGIALALAIDWFPTDASTAAGPIDTLYDVTLVISVPIFVLVMTVAIYSVVRFRARPGDMGDGAPIHGHTGLEIVWVTAPFLIVSALAVYAWVVLDKVEKPAADAMVVDVTAQQFAWSFSYPDVGNGEPVQSNELVLPVGRQADFQIRSLDVLHSFWVPAFRLKSDAVPGITTSYPITPTREGTFDVVCAELCGIGHSTMRQVARVVPQDEFDAWVQERAGGGAAAGTQGRDELAAAGAEVFQANGCGGCHEFTPAGSTGTTGPNLDDLAADADAAGEAPEEYVDESIINPDAVVVDGFQAGTMPANYADTLTPEEIDALTAYLLGSDKEGGK